ncbi:PREDICTED: transmembrane protein FAM155A-like [Cariama cristata]|nr:PREDICTED: transmembrane protein FAM155A-like [Cariama cristata]
MSLFPPRGCGVCLSGVSQEQLMPWQNRIPNRALELSATYRGKCNSSVPFLLRFTELMLCQTVYKAWLCSQYFEVTQFHCSNRIPCKQYCLEVQTRCPFILPDNDDVIYGGLSSFICTGLYENYPTNAEPECCDVRWGLLSDHQSKGTIKTSGSTMCHRTSLTVSSASRLCNSRLKLCVLVLILLHTVLTVSAAQNSTGLGLGGITTLEDNSTNEE